MNLLGKSMITAAALAGVLAVSATPAAAIVGGQHARRTYRGMTAAVKALLRPDWSWLQQTSQPVSDIALIEPDRPVHGPLSGLATTKYTGPGPVQHIGSGLTEYPAPPPSPPPDRLRPRAALTEVDTPMTRPDPHRQPAPARRTSRTVYLLAPNTLFDLTRDAGHHTLDDPILPMISAPPRMCCGEHTPPAKIPDSAQVLVTAGVAGRWQWVAPSPDDGAPR
jgi:hypothetical protein